MCLLSQRKITDMFGANSKDVGKCVTSCQGSPARDRLGGHLVDGVFRASPRKTRGCLKGPDSGPSLGLEAAEAAGDVSSDDDAKTLSRCEPSLCCCAVPWCSFCVILLPCCTLLAWSIFINPIVGGMSCKIFEKKEKFLRERAEVFLSGMHLETNQPIGSCAVTVSRRTR